MFNRVNNKIEVVSLAIIIINYFFVSSQQDGINESTIVISILLYILLSIVFYFTSSPKIVYKDSKNTSDLGEKVEITSDQKMEFYDKGIFYLGITKISIILFLIISIEIGMFSNKFSGLEIIVILFLAVISIYFIGVSNNYFIKSRGYLKAKISNTLFYNNPDDKRAMIDKRVGIGSEINFGSKQGKLVLFVLLAIPISFVAFLLFALALAGKI